MSLGRFLALGVPVLLLLAVLVWLKSEQPETFIPAEQSAPAVVMPTQSASSSDSGKDIDALWKRYEALSASSSATADAVDSPEQVAPARASEESERAAGAQSREALREQAKRRREALLASRDDSFSKLESLKPGDVEGMVAVLEQLNRQLKDNGIEHQIDVDTVRQQMRSSQELAALNEAMLLEAMKGSRADPQRLQQLSRDLREMQETVTDSLNARSGLVSP